MVRVLRPGGRGLVYVWALEQSKGNKRSAYLKQRTGNGCTATPSEHSGPPTALPVHENRTEFVQQDMFVPWKLKNKSGDTNLTDQVYHRFYHTFREGELDQMFDSVEDTSIIETYYDQGNWCIIFEKK